MIKELELHRCTPDVTWTEMRHDPEGEYIHYDYVTEYVEKYVEKYVEQQVLIETLQETIKQQEYLLQRYVAAVKRLEEVL